jgi:hypothetical protein
MKSKRLSDRAPLGCSSSRHKKSKGQPDGGKGGPCSQQTNCYYLVLKAPMALHIHGGPNQIVLLPHVSIWGQTGWLAAPASLFSCAFRVGGGRHEAVSSLLALPSSLHGFSSGMYFEPMDSHSCLCSGNLSLASFSQWLVYESTGSLLIHSHCPAEKELAQIC